MNINPAPSEINTNRTPITSPPTRSSRLRVVAEGVETEGQLAFLREKGCDEVQGFLLGMPAAELP